MYKRPKNHIVEQSITYELDNSGDRTVFVNDVEDKYHFSRPISFYIHEYLLSQDPMSIRKTTDSLTVIIDKKDLKCFAALLDNAAALEGFKEVINEYIKVIEVKK